VLFIEGVHVPIALTHIRIFDADVAQPIRPRERVHRSLRQTSLRAPWVIGASNVTLFAAASTAITVRSISMSREPGVQSSRPRDTARPRDNRFALIASIHSRLLGHRTSTRGARRNAHRHFVEA